MSFPGQSQMNNNNDYHAPHLNMNMNANMNNNKYARPKPTHNYSYSLGNNADVFEWPGRPRHAHSRNLSIDDKLWKKDNREKTNVFDFTDCFKSLRDSSLSPSPSQSPNLMPLTPNSISEFELSKYNQGVEPLYHYPMHSRHQYLHIQDGMHQYPNLSSNVANSNHYNHYYQDNSPYYYPENPYPPINSNDIIYRQNNIQVPSNPVLLNYYNSMNTVKWNLSMVEGSIYEFSIDQYGSRFIQEFIDGIHLEEMEKIMKEITTKILVLIDNQYGNYVIAKFIDYGKQSQILNIYHELQLHFHQLSISVHSCRVIQKLIMKLPVDNRIELYNELVPYLSNCIENANGNHVIQVCIQSIPPTNLDVVLNLYLKDTIHYANHCYGCRIFQLLLNFCKDDPKISNIINILFESIYEISMNQYGNYVIQYILEHYPSERYRFVDKIYLHLSNFSTNKCASNVIEKCILFSNDEYKRKLVELLLDPRNNPPLIDVFICDKYANFVVQKLIENTSCQDVNPLINYILNGNILKASPHRKHIQLAIEKKRNS